MLSRIKINKKIRPFNKTLEIHQHIDKQMGFDHCLTMLHNQSQKETVFDSQTCTHGGRGWGGSVCVWGGGAYPGDLRKIVRQLHLSAVI